MSAAVRLIVNADDFGFFDGVSRGILHCAKAGAVTATGVMANGPALAARAAELASLESISVGVHLNATLGRPLTERMRACLAPSEVFPAKFALALRVLKGRIPVAAVLEEWRAQIRRCLDLGLRPAFLNSHEHVHVLPSLHRAALHLAREFGISNVRVPRAEWRRPWTAGALVRNLAFEGMRAAAPRPSAQEPALIGVGISGKLDIAYCRAAFSALQRPGTYELMCHPGFQDAEAEKEPSLAAYHDWELELRTLTSPEFGDLLRERRIALVSYSDLQPRQ